MVVEAAVVVTEERFEIAVIGTPAAAEAGEAAELRDVDLAVTAPPAEILATREGDMRLLLHLDQPCLRT